MVALIINLFFYSEKFRKILLSVFITLPLLTSSQNIIKNISFEQMGNQIHIYYDLQGEGEFIIQVYCSIDRGKTWGEALTYMQGNIGEHQTAGTEKFIIWDVLSERNELKGDIRFKISAIPKNEKALAFELSVNSGIFVDNRDDQEYEWVLIGKQVWMGENLNFYTTKSKCYKKNESNCFEYGRLYKWDEANNVCPDGWHLPNTVEWDELIKYLGGEKIAGDKLKKNGSNSSNFSALLAGLSGTFFGDYSNLGKWGYWWSATDWFKKTAICYYIRFDNNEMTRDEIFKNTGFSVRCIKD